MGFTFRKATADNIWVIVGLSGGTGSGKTYSAMRLASGLSGGQRFAVIDTEAGRAKHYADEFEFDHGDMEAPFTPDAYLEAIVAAEEAGYPVIVVDSMTHEHAGTGGILDMHADNLDDMVQKRMKRSNDPEWKIREALKMNAWIQPKMAHKRMVQRLLQLRAHLILCSRAEEKTIMEKEKGKTQIRTEWRSVLAKGLEFEMTASFMLHHEQPGVPSHVLKLPEKLRQFFPANKPISNEAGVAMAKWAGGEAKAAANPAKAPAPKKMADESSLYRRVSKALGKADSPEEIDRIIEKLAKHDHSKRDGDRLVSLARQRREELGV